MGWISARKKELSARATRAGVIATVAIGLIYSSAGLPAHAIEIPDSTTGLAETSQEWAVFDTATSHIADETGSVADLSLGEDARPDDAATSNAHEVARLIASAAPIEVDSAIDVSEIIGHTVLADADSAVLIPEDPSEGITFANPQAGEADHVEIGLPVENGHSDAVVADDGTAVFAIENEQTADVAVQATPSNVRISTILHNEETATEFEYSIDGATPVLTSDGGIELLQDVEILGDDGVPVVIKVPTIVAEKPWAVDAEGRSVETYYKITGNSVIQVVEPGAGTVFPVVADPNWVKIGKCVAAITYVAFTTAFIVGKAPKIVKAIKAGAKFVRAVGGIREAAKLAVGASTKKERDLFIARGRRIAGASFLDFVGITQIKSNCF